MSDAVDYLRAYAVRAICKARRMPFGKSKRLQRAVGRIYAFDQGGGCRPERRSSRRFSNGAPSGKVDRHASATYLMTGQTGVRFVWQSPASQNANAVQARS
ncbi:MULTISPECIES: hypothetical protein [unclassified Bradyrhizobium]|uniref:hypothetical protein n=1 Tax=unclassified Bradyrhizobium TaxID=2631580 RepID=UPI0020131157|nr:MULTISPECIES: hypothetical protein [unclassified Bradyrhizobium]